MDLEGYSKVLEVKDLLRNKSLNQLTRIRSEVNVKNKLLEPLRHTNLNTSRLQSNAKPTLTAWMTQNNRFLEPNLSYRHRKLHSTQLHAQSSQNIRTRKDLPSIHRENEEVIPSSKNLKLSAVSRSLMPIVNNKPVISNKVRLHEVKTASYRLEPMCHENLEKEMESSSVFLPA